MARNSSRSNSSSPGSRSRRKTSPAVTEAIAAMPAPLALASPRASAEDAAERHRHMVAEAAYFRALNRGFDGGDPLDDWYVAEKEISRLAGHA